MTLLVGGGIIALGILLWAFLPQASQTAYIGEAEIFLERALTEEERMRGLSGRESLPKNTGLLFVFDRDTFQGIWMKDMLFPIDIIWINSAFRIVHIETNVSPDTFPHVFIPNMPAQYVIEMSSGFVEENEIEVGMPVVF